MPAHHRPWLRHYDPDVLATLDYPTATVHQLLSAAARRFPNRICVAAGDVHLSYHQIDVATDELARGLIDLGIRPGDRVGILMPNVPSFVVAFYAILKAGAAVVALNPAFTKDELAHQVEDSGLQTIFALESGLTKLAALHRSRKPLTIICSTPDAGWARLEEMPPASGATVTITRLRKQGMRSRTQLPKVGPDDSAIFQYSGGTTGVTKAAVGTHGGVSANTLQFESWLHMRDGTESILLAIPLFHAYGMIAGMSLGISVGATLVLVADARNIDSLLAAIEREKPTIFPAVPSLYAALSAHPDVRAGRVSIRSIRACISGSTALLRTVKDRFEELSGARICEGYGLSEAPVVTHCNPLHGINKIGSIGLPMPDVECRVVDPDDAGKDMEPGMPGELILRGPQVMQRYHAMPAETAIALRQLDDGRPWLFTGDIVRMDEDGYFFVVDRKKDVIKAGGFQVWPREVEEVLATHPSVQEVAVAGVMDASRGETVKAWLVLRSPVNDAELKEWCRSRLAAYKIPTLWEFIDQLPRSAVGKVLRRELVRQHQEQSASL